jgi:hypothetical protein
MMTAKRNGEIGQDLFNPQRAGSKVQFLHRAGVPYGKGNNLIQLSLNCD